MSSSQEDINTQKIKHIQETIKLAEEWAKDQTLPESDITRSCLKDIRRIAFT